MYNRQLDTFIRVASCRSFSEAAKELYITPSAVIKQINLLERNLGVKLFARSHRGLMLTNAGISILSDAQYIIQYSNDSVLRAKNTVFQDSNIVRIGTSPLTPAQVLEDLWQKIQSYCPHLKFQMMPFDNTPENEKKILENLGIQIDIVVGIFDQAILDLRKCGGLEISREPICCAVSIDHHLASKESLSINDLYYENLLLLHSGLSNNLDKLRENIIHNHPQIHISDIDIYDIDVFNYCGMSNNILMAVNIWSNVHPLLKFIPVEWEYSMSFGLMHAPDPNETIRHFLQSVQKVINN